MGQHLGVLYMQGSEYEYKIYWTASLTGSVFIAFRAVTVAGWGTICLDTSAFVVFPVTLFIWAGSLGNLYFTGTVFRVGHVKETWKYHKS